MKRNYFKLILLLSCMVIVIISSVLTLDIFTVTNIYYLLFWIITFLCSIFLVGFEKNKNLYKIDIMQIIFIYIAIYLITIHVLGVFSGFIKSPYKLTSPTTIKIILISSAIIIIQELTRYVIIKKAKENKSIILLLILVYTIIDIMIEIKFYNMLSLESVFEAIGLLFLPSIATNLILTYIMVKSNFKPTIMYKIILNMSVYVIPVYPDLGIYIEAVLHILLPTLLFLKLNSFFSKKQFAGAKRISLNKSIVHAPVLITLLLLVALNSGIFRIYILAVGSGSMSPTINKGDVAVVEKLKKTELVNLKVGDVIVYEQNDVLILHRIIEVNIKNNKYIFQTKGDFNDQIDNYLVEEWQIKGKVHLRIPLIGFPSIWLSEVMD